MRRQTWEKEWFMKALGVVYACVGLGICGIWATGCGMVNSDEFRGGVPTRDTVALNVPGAAATGALTVSNGVRSALLGQQADTYVTTRDVTAIVNGGTYSVLTLVRTIVDYPASSVSGDVAVWGPHTEPLSANTWRLTVTGLAPHQFQWLLEARAKTDPDTAFMTIISGTHAEALDAGGRPMEGFGSGNFSIDWDAAAKLPQHDNNVGNAAFTYSRESPTAAVSVDVDFKGIKDDKTGEIHDALYRYGATPGNGGDLQYASDQDAYPGPGPTGTAKEHFTIHSRWQETGAGRCDVQISGGDLTAVLPAGAAGSECWDSNFLSVYRNVAYDPDPAGKWGDEASCAFIPAEYAAI
jgi:hypothetical protein